MTERSSRTTSPGIASPDAGTGTAEASAAGESSRQTWTTRTLLRWLIDFFTQRDLDSPRHVAEMLLAHVLECERLRLYMEVDRPASPDELARLRDLAKRAANHEPVQYLVGEAWFFSRPYFVDGSTLIPRPCTETLVEEVLQFCRARRLRPALNEPAAAAGAPPDDRKPSPPPPVEGVSIEGVHIDPIDAAPPESIDSPPVAESIPGESLPGAGAGAGIPGGELRSSTAKSSQVHTPPLTIADIGTGTGCIAISLAAQLPAARLIATDIAPEALALAQRNAHRHGVAAQIDFREGATWSPIASDEIFDIICANPPYIPDPEWPDVAPNVKDHEPARALRGGPDGLDIIRPLLERAAAHLAPGGLLALEVAASTAATVERLAQSTPGLHRVRIIEDHESLPRLLLAERK